MTSSKASNRPTSDSQPDAVSSLATSTKPAVFELTPPRWRPRLHPGSRQLGAPDVYARLEGKDASVAIVPEDELTETNVKNGVFGRPVVGNETFSAHDMIYDRLKGKTVVQQLGVLFDEVVQRREQLGRLRCRAAPSQYRSPQRVTLNEVKLAAYIKELADSKVPLRKLARSIPHGYRGERMLDMLWNGGNLAAAMAAAVKVQPAAASTPSSSSATASGTTTSGAGSSGNPSSVAIDRAVWFVRVVGASEIHSSRMRQGNSTAYTAEWTGVLIGWLRRQVLELNIVHQRSQQQQQQQQHPMPNGSPAYNSPTPSSPASLRSRAFPTTVQPASHAHFSADEQPYALLLDDDFRDRWLAKWRYSLSLLRALRYESLIDPHVAAQAVLDMLRTSNVVQIFVVLALVEDFLDVIAHSATLHHAALGILTSKLHDFAAKAAVSPVSTIASGSTSVVNEMHAVLLYLIDSSAGRSVCPMFWHRLEPTLVRAWQNAAEGVPPYFAELKELNERLLSGFLDVKTDRRDTHSPSGELHGDVRILDELIVQREVQATFDALFDQRRCGSISGEEKIRTIMIWATTKWRCGSFRPFAAATLIHMYIKHQPSRTAQRRATKLRQQTGHHQSEQHRPNGKVTVQLERVDIDAVVMAWVTDVDAALRKPMPLSDKGSTDEGEGKFADEGVRWRSAMETVAVPALVVLLGELCRRDCFSFQKYLQRLTARGLTAMGGRSNEARGDSGPQRASTGVPDTLHTRLLRSIPLLSPSVPLEHQRRTAIYGNRNKESWEEAMERRAIRELVVKLPFLSSPKGGATVQTAASPLEVQMPPLEADARLHPLTRFWSSSRYVQCRVIRLYVVPILSRHYNQPEGRTPVPESELLSLLRFLSDVGDFAALHGVLGVLDGDERVAVRRIVELVRAEHRLVWLAMGIASVAHVPACMSGVRLHSTSVVETKEGRSEAMLDDEMSKRAAESIRAFHAGREEEAAALLRNSEPSARVALEIVYQGALDLGEDAIDRLTQWFLQLAKGDKVTQTTSLCALLARVDLQGDAERWSAVLVRLIRRDGLSVANLFDSFVEPTFQEASEQTTSQEQVTPRLTLAGDIVAALLTAKSGDEQARTELESARAEYIGPASVKTIVRLVCHLANAEQLRTNCARMATIDIHLLRKSVCANSILHAYVQRELVAVVQLIRKTLTSPSIAHAIVADLLPSMWPWTSDDELVDRCASLTDGIDAFRWEQTLCEVAIAVSDLQRANVSADITTNGKMQTLARHVCDRVLSDEHDRAMTAAALAVLMPDAKSIPFASCLMEERLRRLSLQLEAPFADDGRLRACLLGLLVLRQSLSDQTLSASSTALQALRLITEWFESIGPGTPAMTGIQPVDLPDDGAAPSLELETDENLLVRMGAVCMLMQSDGLLAMPTAKALAPRLFCAVLLVVLTMSREPNASEERLQPLLDVATFVLQRAPADVQQAMQARAQEKIGADVLIRSCALSDVGRRIGALSNPGRSCARSGGDASAGLSQEDCNTLVEASSCGSAFMHGQFAQIFIKPWELHPNMDVVGGSATHHDVSSSTLSGTEIGVLSNNGPISLQLFGAHRTLDRLPDAMALTDRSASDLSARPPASLTFEQSYGVHLAGDPIYARDARRGLLSSHYAAKESNGQEADRHTDVRTLVPALQHDGVAEGRRNGVQSSETCDPTAQESETNGLNGKKSAAKANQSKAASGGQPEGVDGGSTANTTASPAADATSSSRKRKSTAAARTGVDQKAPPGIKTRKRVKKT